MEVTRKMKINLRQGITFSNIIRLLHYKRTFAKQTVKFKHARIDLKGKFNMIDLIIVNNLINKIVCI